MLLDDLDALLAQERRCLGTGDTVGLTALAADKARLVDRIATLPADAADAAMLARLRDAARRNDRLLAAALSGLRAARTKLEIVRRGGPALDTYDRGGQRHSLGSPARRVERKA
jgi:flagellar biosynthesis/type III secretory pathway chaperone